MRSSHVYMRFLDNIIVPVQENGSLSAPPARNVVGLLIVGLLLGVSAVTVHAQNMAAYTGETLPFVTEYHRPGRPTMMIYMLGQVGRPGKWRVEENVDLIDLLSAAGLPGVGQNELDSRSSLILHVYRGDVEARDEIYVKQVDQILESGVAYPALQPGDILILERKTRPKVSMRTVLRYVRTVSSLLSFYLLVRREF